MNNVLVVVVGFFDVTKLALIGVLISFFYSNIRIFRRIFGGQKFGGELGYWRRLGV